MATTSWLNTPSGVSGSFYSTRVDVNRITSGGPVSFRVTIAGIDSSTLANNGIVNSVSAGKTLAFETLKALNDAMKATKAAAVRPALSVPVDAANSAPVCPPTVSDPNLLALRAAALECAVLAINGSVGLLPSDEAGPRLQARLRIVLKTADAFVTYLSAPLVDAAAVDPANEKPPTQ